MVLDLQIHISVLVLLDTVLWVQFYTVDLVTEERFHNFVLALFRIFVVEPKNKTISDSRILIFLVNEYQSYLLAILLWYLLAILLRSCATLLSLNSSTFLFGY